MNERLYLLNQLREQGLDIKCLTDLFVEPVIARFQYVLPALAGQLTASDINGIKEILIKGLKRRLTSKLFKHDDIIEH